MRHIRTLTGLIILTSVFSGYAIAQAQGTNVAQPAVAPAWKEIAVQWDEGIAALPIEQRAVWQAYRERSKALHLADVAVLDAEMKARGIETPLVPATAKKAFKLFSVTDENWFGSVEARTLADTMISFQLPNGGWSKSIAYDQGLRQPGTQWTDQKDPWHYAGTFDNRSTTEQMGLLAKVHQATKDPKYSAAFLKGFDYTLKAQFPNGGWPQVYPLEGGYHDNVTFNDDAMTHALELLRDVAAGQPQFAFVDNDRRLKAKQAVADGVSFLLKSQHKQKGRPTVWGAQHHPLTFAPAAARRQEPLSLSGGESVGIVRFLMSIEKPTPEVIRSVEDALAWFDNTKILGIRETKRDNRLYFAHDATVTTPYWARFYDVDTNQPLFAGGRDGITYTTYDEMWDKNPANYAFYTDKAGRLLTTDQENWRKKLAH